MLCDADSGRSARELSQQVGLLFLQPHRRGMDAFDIRSGEPFLSIILRVPAGDTESAGYEPTEHCSVDLALADWAVSRKASITVA